jgi:hypothetical protein
MESEKTKRDGTMNEPRRLLPILDVAKALRALCRMIPGLFPVSAHQRRADVTRDEITALFAADLSRDRQRRR